jgi:hypothetical protein
MDKTKEEEAQEAIAWAKAMDLPYITTNRTSRTMQEGGSKEAWMFSRQLSSLTPWT